MRVRYRCSEDLPAGVPVALVEGERDAVVLVDPDARGRDIAAHLDAIIGPWVEEAWLHVGAVVGDAEGLRSA